MCFPIDRGGVCCCNCCSTCDDIFAIGQTERCDRFCEDLNHLAPINNLGEPRWYAGCHYSRDKVVGLLTVSQKAFAEKTVKPFGVTAASRNTPLSTEAFLGEFDEDKPDGVWPLRELVRMEFDVAC